MVKHTLAEWRQIRNLSQLKLSVRSDVMQATISQIETGRKKYLKTQTLAKLTAALDITPEEMDLQEMVVNEAGQPPKGDVVTPGFLEQLRAGLRAEDLTVGELADAVDRSAGYLNKLLQGKVERISYDTRDKIAERLGFDPSVPSAPAAEPEREEKPPKEKHPKAESDCKTAITMTGTATELAAQLAKLGREKIQVVLRLTGNTKHTAELLSKLG